MVLTSSHKEKLRTFFYTFAGRFVSRPNDLLISCKRLLTTFWSTALTRSAASSGVPPRPRLSAALVG
jgi:hypothetical protein